jgi:hypothetical protein
MRSWRLFIDETGDFDSPRAQVAVVGLLLNEASGWVDPGRMKRALTAIAPEVPWPPHATVLRLPLAWAAWGPAAPSQPWEAAADAVRSLLRDQLPEDWAVLCTLVAGGKLPSGSGPRGDALRERLVRLAEKRAPGPMAVLRAHAAAVSNRMATLPREIQQGPDPASASVGWCLLAAESVIGDAIGADASGDRYTTMLVSLLRRVMDVLHACDAEGPERHEVRVGASRRGLHDLRLGVARPLAVADLSRACVAATGSDTREHRKGPSRVRFIPEEVPRYDRQCPPGYVLADRAANSIFGVLRADGSGRLEPWIASLERATSWGFRASTRRLPTTAATGEAERWMQARREPSGLVSESGAAHALYMCLPWAREQAERWVNDFSQRPTSTVEKVPTGVA